MSSTSPLPDDLSAPPLPTWIIVHPRENRKKCSVEPLRGRPDFHFANYHAKPMIDKELFANGCTGVNFNRRNDAPKL